jgi:hypothetical protein
MTNLNEIFGLPPIPETIPAGGGGDNTITGGGGGDLTFDSRRPLESLEFLVCSVQALIQVNTESRPKLFRRNWRKTQADLYRSYWALTKGYLEYVAMCVDE